ncbi:MAG: hypothetical protein ACXVP4_02545, partial [Bacteroidia bacterium]
MKKYLLIFSLLIISLSIEASNYYWVGGTGNWSDFSNHWATTSGGSVFHVQIPTPADNVYFDANSFAGSGNTVYVDTTAIYCKDMNWTGATGSPTFTTSSASSVYSIQIYGSLTLTNNMTWYFNGSVNFESTTPGNTIKTNGVALNGNYTAKVYFNGVNGSWALQDSITATAIQVNSGATFHTNNYKVNCNSLGSAYGFTNNGRTTLGTSTVNCYYFSSYSRLIDADSSIINVTQGFQGADSIVYNKVNMGCSTCFPSIGPLHFCSFNQINAQGNAFNFYGSANDVNLLASSAPTTFFSGINHFTRADFTNDVTFSDSTHFDTLNFNNPGEIITLAAGKVQFVSSVLNLSGTCTGYTTVHSSSLSGVQASIYKNGAAVVSNYILLKDVNASGTSFTANNSIDNGNNTGWTINTASARSLYWVGNTGNWSDPANWALTSGGTGGNCQPTQNDNVYFDINSFASSGDIVYIDQPIVYCKNMDWTGTTGSPAFLTSTLSISYQVKIYGSLILPPHLTNYINGSFSFESTATGNTIKTNGTVIDADLVFEGVNGSWNALDSISSRDITIKPGATFNTNNNAINCSPGSSLGFLNQGRANLGTSILNCTNFNNYTHSMDADSAVINVSYGFNTQDSLAYNKVNMGCPTCTPNMNAASCSFNKISASGLALNFYGSANDISFLVSSAPTTLYTGINNFTRADFTNNVTLSDTTYFDTLNFNNVGKVITLGAGKVQFVNSVLNLSGSCSAYTTLKSTSISGVRGTINKTGSAVVADYLILKDIAATGTSFTANNSIDNGNNLGWAISGPAARNLYWVGNTNNWSNPASWALTSGGAGGNCPPTQNDNVYFDANSFVSAGDVVTVDSSIIYCNNMDWTGATGNPSFNTPSGSTTYSFQLFGSLALVNGMTWNFNGDINFESTAPGNTIKTNGVILNGNYTSRLVFDGVNGTWDLQDSLSTAGMQVNTAATFKTNNNGMNCSTSGSSFGLVNNGTLKLGTSTISCYNFTTNSHLADADSAILNISAGFSTADSMTYNKINLGCGTCFSSLYAMHCSF